jgi:beta-lactamase class C
MRPNTLITLLTALTISLAVSPSVRAADNNAPDLEKIVGDVIQPMMRGAGIAGMVAGITINGRRHLYSFGVMSKATNAPVTADTLFEIGSVSKTFTATLTAYAQVRSRLSLSDSVSKHLPALRGSGFDKVSVAHLGTHTFGGLPLQVPGNIKNDDQLMRYFRAWKPAHTPGTVRTYSNPSIGLMGMVTAHSLDGRFDDLMQTKVFDALGLRQTYLHVPKAVLAHYAQGYTKTDAPVRMTPGLIAQEAYGVRTTGGDLLRFVEANMGLIAIDRDVQAALAATHTGYYRLGAMTQDLVWEQYRYPVALGDLVAGNSAKISLEPIAVTRLDPPLPPQADVLINKTGSTAGFGAYAAFVPAKKIGIVLLANKNYPNEARVTAVHEILKRLTGDAP